MSDPAAAVDNGEGPENEGPGIGELVARAISRSLDAAEAEAAFRHIMEGRASAARTAALLAALRARGETPQEVAGGVRALRAAMVPVPVEAYVRVVDTCGTGGGDLTTFNISTAAALVAAAGGASIAKHGNRSYTSRSGSADVLEALGVRIDLTPDGMGEVLARAGIVFMFAPLLHPAMRHVGPVRRELGAPTIMNLLGPLTNPAGARRQVIGVSHPGLLELVADALVELEHEHALVVHGEPGMDELSPLGATRVLEVQGGEVHRRDLNASRFGWRGFAAEDLNGAAPAQNAALIERLFAGGGPEAARAAVALNAGAALYVAGRTESIEAGVERALDLMSDGSAAATLALLRETSSEVASRE